MFIRFGPPQQGELQTKETAGQMTSNEVSSDKGAEPPLAKSKYGRVWTIFGLCGGCGVSTSAAALCKVLEEGYGLRTFLINLDPFEIKNERDILLALAGRDATYSNICACFRQRYDLLVIDLHRDDPEFNLVRALSEEFICVMGFTDKQRAVSERRLELVRKSGIEADVFYNPEDAGLSQEEPDLHGKLSWEVKNFALRTGLLS